MYTVHQAKTNLSKLIAEAEAGKEVVIARGNKPVAKLIPIAPKKDKNRGYGIWKGKIWAAPDAFDPLTDEELKNWGIE
jgi:prevent-host-death family protein